MGFVSDEVWDIQKWLLLQGRDSGTIRKFLPVYTKRCRTLNVPIDRVHVATRLVHPQIGAYLYKFLVDPEFYTESFMSKELIAEAQEKGYDKTSDAPFNQLITGVASFVRCQAGDEYFPEDVRSMFAKEGYTDYYALPIHVGGEVYMAVSWGTKAAGGFTEGHIQFLDETQPALGTTLLFILNQSMSHSLLCSYLGQDSGHRVFRGSVDRGDGDTLRSCIWFSDIRGFTKLSNQLEGSAVIDLINDVCELTEKVLDDHGGEILKVMGDGIMAIFVSPDSKRDAEKLFSGEEWSALGSVATNEESGRSRHHSSLDNRSSLCENARKAAGEFQARLVELRNKRKEQGLVEPNVGVGLHYGSVFYGNIGGKNRLDFTVIGKEVNLASRIEGLCSKLTVPVLATEEFVKRDTDETVWKSRGDHSVKGVPDPVSVYELALDLTARDTPSEGNDLRPADA